MVNNYREGYSIFACNGIIFNHESPRGGETFVTHKITRGVARIITGKDKKLYLGNLKIYMEINNISPRQANKD